MQKIYPDANIFIAQWKGNNIGVKPFGEFARDFFAKMLNDKIVLVVSDLTYFEVQKDYTLSRDMPSVKERERLFGNLVDNFKKAQLYEYVSSQHLDYKKAGMLMRKYKEYEPHFNDLLHAVLSDRSGATLLTEDKLLVEICESENIKVMALF